MSKAFRLKIGRNIKYARKNKGLSQEKLAELIKKTRNYVGMVERAEINPPLSVILDISIALNVEAKIFFEI